MFDSLWEIRHFKALVRVTCESEEKEVQVGGCYAGHYMKVQIFCLAKLEDFAFAIPGFRVSNCSDTSGAEARCKENSANQSIEISSESWRTWSESN
jgi:hypothetical protein